MTHEPILPGESIFYVDINDFRYRLDFTYVTSSACYFRLSYLFHPEWSVSYFSVPDGATLYEYDFNQTPNIYCDASMGVAAHWSSNHTKARLYLDWVPIVIR